MRVQTLCLSESFELQVRGKEAESNNRRAIERFTAHVLLCNKCRVIVARRVRKA